MPDFGSKQWVDPIGLLSLAISILSYWTARKAYVLAANKEQRQAPSLWFSIQDFFAFETADNMHRVYCALASFTNQSDARNSVSRIEMVFSYSKSAIDDPMTLRIPASQIRIQWAPEDSNKLMVAPFSLDGRETSSGLLQFSVPSSVMRDIAVTQCSVAFVDSHGREHVVSAPLVREAVHAINS